ncbi:hypothetical protein DLD82_10915 [Methanospirillum stamsii]|uniref:Tyr recombinase domain-containing protein n=2 Tax=Methanospirillum stamsii TaxID=1277351 RepID=A0A2V2N0U9_9EURY|nr:hypothetical protein DLD82_10915 [Methanospirillum stamsii]
MITGDTNFHSTNEDYQARAKKQMDKCLASGKITGDDAKYISGFIAETKATSQISSGRAYKLQYLLIGWRDFISEFKTLDTNDVFCGIENIKSAKKPDGSPKYKSVTVTDHIKILKRFLGWMAENHYANPNLNLAKLSKIKSPGYRSLKTAEMMLTADEVTRLIECADNPRDRCFVALLYESACRIGELGVMKWNQIKFTGINAILNTNEKTGCARFIPVFMAVEYLKAWHDSYPGGKPDPEDHVFVNLNSKEPLVYRTYGYMLADLAKKAEIEKHFSPHTLRHTRISHLLQAGYSESSIRLVAWGSLSSNMLANYAHITNSDVENEYYERLGITPIDKTEETNSLEARQCNYCKTLCSPLSNFCHKCGQPLNQSSALAINEVQNFVESEFSNADEIRLKKLILEMKASGEL